MAKTKSAHHRGNFDLRSTALRAAAYANPHTRCWRCGLTLTEHPPHRNGKPARWTAGHIVDGQIGGELRPEASTCNYSAGATAGNRKRNPTSEQW